MHADVIAKGVLYPRGTTAKGIAHIAAEYRVPEAQRRSNLSGPWKGFRFKGA
jgi:hypothetical protein